MSRKYKIGLDQRGSFQVEKHIMVFVLRHATLRKWEQELYWKRSCYNKGLTWRVGPYRCFPTNPGSNGPISRQDSCPVLSVWQLLFPLVHSSKAFPGRCFSLWVSLPSTGQIDDTTGNFDLYDLFLGLWLFLGHIQCLGALWNIQPTLATKWQLHKQFQTLNMDNMVTLIKCYVKTLYKLGCKFTEGRTRHRMYRGRGTEVNIMQAWGKKLSSMCVGPKQLKVISHVIKGEGDQNECNNRSISASQKRQTQQRAGG